MLCCWEGGPSHRTMSATMVYRCDDSHGGEIVPPCSFLASFVTAATTHRANMMSLTGGCSSMIDLAWRLQSKTVPMPMMMLLLTSLEIIANLLFQSQRIPT